MSISSRYDPKTVEPKVLKQWLEGNFFHAEAGFRGKAFSIVIPPPNITGILHMGHALNNTIQDVLIRYRRMQGYHSLWMPGTDHAGIATQNVVEKDLARAGLRKEIIGRTEFTEKLWAWKEKYGSTIIGQLKKLGASCDWQRTRFTLDAGYSDAVAEVFIKLYKQGLIYRGNYIINWCPRCKTALSNEETAHKEIDGWLYYIRYPVKPPAALPAGQKPYVVVATTRPETMLGDTAVAVNPGDKRYQWLKETKVILPVVNRELPVIEDKAVDPGFGTGVVKVTPAHDPVDFNFGKKHNLEFVNIMNEDATLNDNVPTDFVGMDRFEAREALITLLEDKKLIEKKEPYTISAGHCYRCHTIVEPRLSLQWFVRMKPLAEKAIKVVEKDRIKFYPQRWKKVYLNWMYNIQDWCISRQIWWGHRLPVYYCRSCQKPIVSKVKPDKCPDCKGVNITQDEDVLDTWFSSWLWPFVTFGWPKNTRELKSFYPTSCLVTASEILFFWVARMIIAGLTFTRRIPFSDVIIHGTVRDERGVKMSKSLGNTIDPLEIIDEFGADALRFSLILLAAGGSDVYLNREKFLVGRNFANKVWNATRFILSKVKENNLVIDNLKLNGLDSVDTWALSELNSAAGEVSRRLDQYAFNEAAKKVYDFFWHLVCDWYIEIVKDDFTLNKAKVSVYLLLNSIKLLHPFMPFISEEIFLLIKSSTQLDLAPMLVGSDWPRRPTFKGKRQQLERINSLVTAIRNLRNVKADLGLGQKKVTLEVCLDAEGKKLWEENIGWIERLTLSKTIVFKRELSRVLYRQENLALNLDIESADLNTFLASLDKKIRGLEVILQKSGQRLKNDNFLSQAASTIVENEKQKFAEVSANCSRMKQLKDAFK